MEGLTRLVSDTQVKTAGGAQQSQTSVEAMNEGRKQKKITRL